MNIVKIPTSFELARCKHAVNVIDHLDNENFGNSCNSDLIINIATNSKRNPITKDKQINTFYHELVHSIFFAIERDEDLGSDETLVTAIGNMLMEFDLTRDICPVNESNTCSNLTSRYIAATLGEDLIENDTL